MKTSPPSPAALSPKLVGFLQQGVSITLASRDSRHVPSVSRVLACRVEDKGVVTLFLVRSQAGDLLRDLGRCGRGAVVFSRPRTHQTLQIKGDVLGIGTPEAAAATSIAAQINALQQELIALGFAEPMLQCFFGYEWSDLAAVSLRPTTVYEQTPGPRAGQRMEPAP